MPGPTTDGFPHFKAMIPSALVRDKIAEIGRDAARVYAGKQLTTVSVLNGAAMFAAEFQKSLDETIVVDQQSVKITSYRGGTESGEYVPNYDLLDPSSITGRHVLILDDILDTGQTLYKLKQHLLAMNPLSLRIAVLLHKVGKLNPDYPVTADLCCFQIPDAFVIGYGMDYEDNYRNLRYIAEFDPDTHKRIQAWLEQNANGSDDPTRLDEFAVEPDRFG